MKSQPNYFLVVLAVDFVVVVNTYTVLFKLRLGALIPRSVCLSVGLSVGLSVLQKLQKNLQKFTKAFTTLPNIEK